MVLFYLSGSTNIFNFGNDAAFNPEVSGESCWFAQVCVIF